MYSNISLLFSAPIPLRAANPLRINGQPQLPGCAETHPDGDQHALHPRVALRHAHQHGRRLSRRVRLGRVAGRVRGRRNRRTCCPSLHHRLLLTYSSPSPLGLGRHLRHDRPRGVLLAQRVHRRRPHARRRHDLHRRQPVHDLLHGREEPGARRRAVLHRHPRTSMSAPSCSAFADDFLQIATAIGLAVTSAITTTVTVNQSRDALPSPETLLGGYQAAGWICFTTALIGLPLNFWSLRGLGVIGRINLSEADDKKPTTKADNLPGVSSDDIGATKEKSVGV